MSAWIWIEYINEYIIEYISEYIVGYIDEHIIEYIIEYKIEIISGRRWMSERGEHSLGIVSLVRQLEMLNRYINIKYNCRYKYKYRYNKCKYRYKYSV